MSAPLKILLYRPWPALAVRPRTPFSSYLQPQPLDLATLAALVPEELEAQIDVCDERLDHFEKYDKQYQIVVFSFAAAAAPRAYQLAAHYHSLGAYTVFTGSHMLYNAEEGLKYADTVIVGAPERAFPAFLFEYLKRLPQRRYEWNELEPGDYVAPRRSALKSYGYLNIPSIQANPSQFQDLGGLPLAPERRSEPRTLDELLAELESVASPNYYFYDPDFFSDRDEAIARMMALRRLNIQWYGAGSLALARDEELFYWARQSGCRGLQILLRPLLPKADGSGFEDPRACREAVAALQAAGISVWGSYLLGYEEEREESLLNLAEQVEYLDLSLVRFQLYTPLPGSPVHRQLKAEGRILTENWADYHGQKMVFEPLYSSPERLEELYYLAWRHSYSWPRLMRRLRGHKTAQESTLFCTNLGLKFQHWES